MQMISPQVGHEIPLAGHLGADKTRQYILRLFCWPIIFKDIEEFCRCYEICQKTSGQKVPPAPLTSLPVITEPFKKIAMDIVGGGNVYILVLYDHTTCYPEAILLKSIDAAHIAEELIINLHEWECRRNFNRSG